MIHQVISSMQSHLSIAVCVFLLFFFEASSFDVLIPKSLKQFSGSFIASFVLTSQPSLAVAEAEPLPSIEKCFSAIRKELDNSESLNRLQTDINQENWVDIIKFSREYDAGFRGVVLKSLWKQLGEGKDKGIELTNSFTYDLIGLNKAARNHDADDANYRLKQVRSDLTAFLELEKP